MVLLLLAVSLVGSKMEYDDLVDDQVGKMQLRQSPAMGRGETAGVFFREKRCTYTETTFIISNIRGCMALQRMLG
ncbi:hypothetical protein H4582DRAFT_364886 [Lactarius indigo]|nr:hypothetical protein H4582DRAFT_364886 [Lactarius indigo]